MALEMDAWVQSKLDEEEESEVRDRLEYKDRELKQRVEQYIMRD